MAVFSPDDTRVGTACRDETALIWDAATGRRSISCAATRAGWW